MIVKNCRANEYFKDAKVGEAMNAIDRVYFCKYKNEAYLDLPSSLDFGATISAPHMHAYALQILFADRESDRGVKKFLDVGSGSDYLCAAALAMMDYQGTVVGIEHIEELANWSKQNLETVFGPEYEKYIKIICADGRLGEHREAPFDAIHVGAASPKIPEKLLEQLAPNGRMMVPVDEGEHIQHIVLCVKDEKGNTTFTKLLGVRYVPLTSREKQLSGKH